MTEKLLTHIREIKYLTMNVAEVTVDLIMPDFVSFRSGQYMEMEMGPVKKSFFIASVPDHNQYLKFCVEIKPGSAEKTFFKNAFTGMEINFYGPSGKFFAPEHFVSLCCLAEGAGVAPFASVVPDLLSRGIKSPISLVFSLDSEDNVFYFDKFSHLKTQYANFDFVPMLSDPKSYWPGEIGKVDTFLKINYDSGKDKDAHFMICGSAEFIFAAESALLAQKHESKKIIKQILNH